VLFEGAWAGDADDRSEDDGGGDPVVGVAEDGDEVRDEVDG
jgi:hypothetical protein